ncbi:MAG: acyl-CoA dehydrogenase family protein [Gulosibacter sp.]|uniref:acyl-CoA dehydrogenase family protein n=1 Tax=Gulosibacter sp. TaxID=2817531 RepID=UPI003F905CA4
MTSKPTPLGLEEEHVALKDMVRDFVNQRVLPGAGQRDRNDIYPEELIPELAELGLFGITISEEFGGSDADYVSYGVIFEELGRGQASLASLVYTNTAGGYLIDKFGTQEQKERFLPGIVSGERMSAIAMTEPSTGSDLKDIKLTARREGDNYIVNGSKIFITHGRRANPVLLLAKTDPTIQPAHRGGISMLLIEHDTPGLSYGNDFEKLGHKGLELAELVFENAVVPAKNLLGDDEGKGFYQMMAALDRGRIYMAASSTGMAQACLDEALKYATQRETFGQPLSDRQAIQMKLADMATSIEASRLLYLNAAHKTVAEGRASGASAMAKIYATESAMKSIYDAMQILGGSGYIKEFPIERYFRDAALMPIGEGSNDILRFVLAKELVAGMN